MADKLRGGKNLQNRKRQTWLSEDEYAQIEAELREELKDKPSKFNRYEENLQKARFTKIVQKATATKADTQRLRSSTTN